MSTPAMRPARLVPLASFVLLALFALVASGCAHTPSTSTSPATTASAPAAPAAEGRAVLMPVPSDPTITFKLQVRAGSIDDPPGKEGLALLTARMIGEGGAGALRYDQILEALAPLAASYGVSVDKELTVVTGRAHRDHAAVFARLFIDAVTKPRFAEDDFRRLRDDAINDVEKTLRYSSDEELGKAALQALVFEGTPYRHPVTGTVRGLRAITLDDVRAFHARFWTRANVVLGLAGGYDAPLPKMIESGLAALPAGPAPPIPPVPQSSLPAGISVVLLDKPNADASISFGRPIAVRRGQREFYALAVANSWLGEHRNSSSHLYQVIRETRGLNYGDYSYIEAFPQGGMRQTPPTGIARRAQLFEVWIRTLPNEAALFATRAALREIDGIVRDGLGESEVALTREFLSKYTLHHADTTAARLGYALDDAYLGLAGKSHLEIFRETIPSLTRDEVNEAVRASMTPEPLAIAIVTGDAQGLAAALANGAPTPITYATPKPVSVLSEDEAIAAFPLRVPKERIRILPITEVFEQ